MMFVWCGARIVSIGKKKPAVVLNTLHTMTMGWIGIFMMRMISVPAEKGKLMEPYKILMLVILLVLEIPAAIILAVEWFRACRKARRKYDG